MVARTPEFPDTQDPLRATGFAPEIRAGYHPFEADGARGNTQSGGRFLFAEAGETRNSTRARPTLATCRS
jgi:hypothetical protein